MTYRDTDTDTVVERERYVERDTRPAGSNVNVNAGGYSRDVAVDTRSIYVHHRRKLDGEVQFDLLAAADHGIRR